MKRLKTLKICLNFQLFIVNCLGWYNYAETHPNPNAKKTFWTKGNIYADIVAGGQSAVWGFVVAGPLGSAMVGISGAFIGSGVKQALSNVLN